MQWRASNANLVGVTRPVVCTCMHLAHTHHTFVCIPHTCHTVLSQQEALKGLHWLPTLDCLALSPDPAIKARAAAALAALVTAGQLDSQDAQLRWRDMLLGWLGTSAGNLLLHTSSSGSGSGGGGESQQQQESSLWLWQWFGSDSGSGGSSSESSSSKRAQASAADEALARSCVAGLKGGWFVWLSSSGASEMLVVALECCGSRLSESLPQHLSTSSSVLHLHLSTMHPCRLHPFLLCQCFHVSSASASLLLVENTNSLGAAGWSPGSLCGPAVAVTAAAAAVKPDRSLHQHHTACTDASTGSSSSCSSGPAAAASQG